MSDSMLDLLDTMRILSLSESILNTVVLYVSNRYVNFVSGLLLNICDSFLVILKVVRKINVNQCDSI